MLAAYRDEREGGHANYLDSRILLKLHTIAGDNPGASPFLSVCNPFVALQVQRVILMRASCIVCERVELAPFWHAFASRCCLCVSATMSEIPCILQVFLLYCHLVEYLIVRVIELLLEFMTILEYSNSKGTDNIRYTYFT